MSPTDVEQLRHDGVDRLTARRRDVSVHGADPFTWFG